jgi:polyisoprenoid-binding protein YceI
LAISLLTAASNLSAQQMSVDFDPAKTQIHWSLAGNVHTTHGTFRFKQGHVSLNPATGAISGDLIADATSGDSGNGARDKRMNKEILESEKYPEFRFTPQKLEGPVSMAAHSTVQVSGTFLVHGSNHSLTIPMEVTIANGTVTGSGKFSIPFVDWGMKDPSNFLFKVDKSVEVQIEAVGTFTSK